jgi:hypothetical protein
MLQRHVWLASLVLAAWWIQGAVGSADDPPSKQDAAAKADDPAAQLQSLKKEFAGKMSELQKAFSEAKTPDDRRKLMAGAQSEMSKLTEKGLKLLDSSSDDKTTWDVVTWLGSLNPSKEQQAKLEKRLKELVDKSDLESLGKRLTSMPPQPSLYAVGIAIFRKVKNQPDAKGAENLVAWAAQTTAYNNGSQESSKTYNESIEFLADKFPTSKHFEVLCQLLATDDDPAWAQKQLRKVLAANKEGKIHLWAQYALGAMLASNEGTAKEGIEMLEAFLKSAKGNDGSRDLQFAIRNAEGKLDDIKVIGSPAKEISGMDLQDKAIKLSDYKGKVVLLDFWGFW